MVWKGNRRTRKQRGAGWAFTGETLAGVNNYGQINTPIGDCRAATPPGFIAPPYNGRGLPGMAGGRRRNNDGVEAAEGSDMIMNDANDVMDQEMNVQAGGRYTFDLSSPVPDAAAPWAGGIPPVQRIACEGSTPNPLNAGPHTPSTAPPAPSGTDFFTKNGVMSGAGRRNRKNRKNRRGTRRQRGGGLGTDNLAYYAPTAGYANVPSLGAGAPERFVDSVGAPVLLQKPYDAQAWNPACVKTGGRRRRNTRRSNRKNRRNTRRRR